MKVLSKSEIKELNERIEREFGAGNLFSKQDVVHQDDRLIIKDKKPVFFQYEDRLVPSLHLLLVKNILKTVSIDMGAVKFVAGGADVMRPGIVRLDDGIQQNQCVAVVDERHGKPLAVGISLFSGKDILEMKVGKVIRNIHHVGDDVWTYSSE